MSLFNGPTAALEAASFIPGPIGTVAGVASAAYTTSQVVSRNLPWLTERFFGSPRETPPTPAEVEAIYAAGGISTSRFEGTAGDQGGSEGTLVTTWLPVARPVAPGAPPAIPTAAPLVAPLVGGVARQLPAFLGSLFKRPKAIEGPRPQPDKGMDKKLEVLKEALEQLKPEPAPKVEPPQACPQPQSCCNPCAKPATPRAPRKPAAPRVTLHITLAELCKGMNK
jgi:hypothetical protein